MINALESLNLTQRSQSNAKEMSWDERGCFGLAQCAHKNVKSPRERARSRPRGIYRRTPSQIAVGLKSCTTDASVSLAIDAALASDACPSATCPEHLKSNSLAPNSTDAYIVIFLSVYRADRCNTESAKSWFAPTDASGERPTDAPEHLSLARLPDRETLGDRC
jgi:hypothetical protein